MALTLELSPQTEAKLSELARVEGMDIETYLKRYLEILASPRSNTLAESLGPKGTSESDAWTEEEVSGFLERQIDAARAERRARTMP